jgi:LysR family transcriptional regulator for metE and metH
MYNIDVQHLKVVRAIEKDGSMRRAADTLNLSQSALSHHIKELERNIGAKIFDRRNKKLWLTETGIKLLESSDIILAELIKLENEINTLKKGDSGIIRISTECYTTYNWLPKLISRFGKKYPQAQVQIVAEATRKPISYLQNGQLDIAVVSRGNQQKSNFKYIPLLNDELMVVLHKENPLSRQKSVRPRDLQKQSLIVYDSEDKDIDLIQYVLRPKNIIPLRIIKMQLTEVIVEMVKSNLGIAIMAKWLITSLITEELVLLPFNDDFAKRTWHLVTHQHTSVLQNKFVDFATVELSGILS